MPVAFRVDARAKKNAAMLVLRLKRKSVLSAVESMADSPSSSISFVVAGGEYSDRCAPLLKRLAAALQGDDELILLVRRDHPQTATFRPEALRVIELAGASIYRMRAHLPKICRREWVVLLEDHTMVEPSAIDAIRGLIRERPDIDLIPFLGKNLTSTGRWGWANFLFTFGPVWAPLDHPPPFSIVTSAVIRRSRLGAGEPLKDGQWELAIIPGIYRSGKFASSNLIFVDHIKPLRFLAALALNFYNARSGAAIQLDLGHGRRRVIREGWLTFWKHPRRLIRTVRTRWKELPAGTRARLYALGFVFLVGNVTATLFGGGRAVFHID